MHCVLDTPILHCKTSISSFSAIRSQRSESERRVGLSHQSKVLSTLASQSKSTKSAHSQILENFKWP